MTTRVSTLALVNNVLRDTGFAQERLVELQQQISSGSKSQNFAGLDGSVEKFTLVSAQIDRAKQYQANNQGNIAKLQTADVALSKIVDIADKIKTNIIAGNGADLKSANLPQAIGDLLTAFGSELNASHGGRYIFAGTDTATPPVTSTTAANAAIGVPDSVYYTGATTDATMRLDDRTTVAFPLRADDKAFQKIYAAARQAINAAQNGDSEGLKQAQQLIQSGQDDLVAARSKLGGTLANVQSTNDRLAQLTTHWQELTDSISKTDIVAASTEVANYQSVLQASYQVYARLSQIKLSDYL